MGMGGSQMLLQSFKIITAEFLKMCFDDSKIPFAGVV